MDIHHIFIFSNAVGDEANDLVNFGLSEGSFRITSYEFDFKENHFSKNN